MNFIKILDIDPLHLKDSCVAFLGGGGKTSLMEAMGRELALQFRRVILTSRTRAAVHQDQPYQLMDNLQDQRISDLFDDQNPLFIMGSIEDDLKLNGITEEYLPDIQDQCDIILCECDGARQRSLKAHLDHDPEVPELVTHVVILVGADIVNQPVSDETVHRLVHFTEKWELSPDMNLTPKLISRILTAPEGYLEKVNHHPRIIYFINKTDTHPEEASQLAAELITYTSNPVFTGSIQKRTFTRIES